MITGEVVVGKETESNVRQRRCRDAGGPETVHKGQQSNLQITSFSIGRVCGWATVTIFAAPFLALLYLELFVPCPIDPVAHTFPPVPKFVGPLEPNDLLSKAEKAYKGQLRGPESMAFHNDKLYSGLADGRIIEIDLKTDNVRTLVETLGKPPCGKVSDEKNCGRPLGLRLKHGFLYVVDAYLGLFKIDIKTGEFENLFPATISLPDGYAPKFLNDVEVTSEGIVYVTDSSHRWSREFHMYNGFEGRADGRLISFNQKTKEAKVVLRNLNFANGLQLSPKEDFILITEMSRCRVQKLNLKGSKAGQLEMFHDNLPGLPDNIRPSARGGYWVALCWPRKPELQPTLWDTIAPYPIIKRTLAKLFDKQTLSTSGPKYGIVVELDSNGDIVRSLQDPTGATLPASSEVQEYNGTLYIGSYYLPWLGKLRV